MEGDLKVVSTILNAPATHQVGDGFQVSNFFPEGHKISMSPFFLLDFNAKMEFKGTGDSRGAGLHPHRGFETVTIIYHGAITHHDSAGNTDIIYPGDVQWMTAGRGILHKESLECEFSKTGGTFQMVHLWVNLPAKDKMTPPRYQTIKQCDSVKYSLPADAGIIEIIAGEYNGLKSSICTFTDLHVYNAKLNEAGEAVFNFPATFNTGFLIIEGSILVNGTEEATEGQFIHFQQKGEEIQVKALQNSLVLILSGAPINEPIVQYGPFLMNTEEEIKQAINDYNYGRFGYLEE